MRTARSRCKLNARITLALELVLMFRKMVRFMDVIKNQAVVDIATKLFDGIGGAALIQHLGLSKSLAISMFTRP